MDKNLDEKNSVTTSEINKKSLGKNISVTVFANGFGFLVSILTTFILPNLAGKTGYGLWQYYLMVSGYTLYFSLGLTDGAYIRSGGQELKDLDKRRISSQFWLLFFANLIINLGMVGYFAYTLDEPNKLLTVILAGMTGLIAVPRSLITLLLQATNNFKENAFTVILERIVFVAGIIFLVFVQKVTFTNVILFDVGGKLCATLYILFKYPQMILARFIPLREALIEAFENIKIGVNIVLASLSSILTLNIIRTAIEGKWGIETFGQVSLSISISNMFIVFINAVAIVLFPTLRRVSEEMLPKLYRSMECVFITLMGFLLIFYFPGEKILVYILPDSAEGISYLALLFPLFLYEGKNSLLLNTYFKVLRMERVLLFVNAVTIIFSFVLSYITVHLLGDLSLAIVAILVVQMFRAILGEILISKRLNTNPVWRIAFEIILTLGFMIFVNVVKGLLGLLGYVVVFVIYVFIRKNQIKQAINTFTKSKTVDAVNKTEGDT